MKIIMLPGMDGTGELFEEFSKHLKSLFSVSVCRYSTDSALGYDELQKMVEQSLPTNEPYIVLAESFSGPIGIRIAAQQPNMLRGLILVNTFLKCPRPTLARLLPLVPNVVLNKPPNFLVNYILRNTEIDSLARGRVFSVLKMLDAPLIRSRLSSIRHIDSAQDSENVSVPVFVLQSKSDTLVPKSAARELSAAFIECEVVKMPGDHFLLQAHPKKSATEVIRFCNSVNSHGKMENT